MDESATFETRAVLAPRRRRRALLGISAAAIVIAATVGAGFLGNRPAVAPRPAADAPLSSGADAVAVAPPAPRPTLSNFHPWSLPRYPTSVLGIRVQPAAFAEVDHDGSNGMLAIAGWFAAKPGNACTLPEIADDPSLSETFGVSADPDTFCDRSGEVFTAPVFGEIARPIPVQLRPGVPAPDELRSSATIKPVVLVGRFASAGSPCTTLRTCDGVLIVDRVAWSGGQALPRMSSVLPALLAWWPPLGSPARDRLIAKAIGDSGEVLLDTMVDPMTLARIDPAAARILEVAAPAAERIWYRRVLGADPAVDPVLWVAIDDATGNVIGSGSVSG